MRGSRTKHSGWQRHSAHINDLLTFPKHRWLKSKKESARLINESFQSNNIERHGYNEEVCNDRNEPSANNHVRQCHRLSCGKGSNSVDRIGKIQTRIFLYTLRRSFTTVVQASSDVRK